MSTILIGVDDSARSEDAVAFARRLAGAASGQVILACAFLYSDIPTRASNVTYREALKTEASRTARRMAELLSDVPLERVRTATVANPSVAHALTDLAEAEQASIIVVGSTHTGRAGRVLPGSTAERLLHGAPCAVAVVPNGYCTTTHPAIRRIGVAYNATDEAPAAAEAARAVGAELEVIGVVAADDYGAPALMGGPSYDTLREDIEEHVQKSLDAVVKGLPADVHGETIRLSGDPADQIAARSGNVDLMVMGSRGYGPVHAVLAGGVSGRVVREAQCPVIVVPRGVQAPLRELFGAAAAARV
ncbi:universal stress protein [Candidatus Solirubrobacter pratensis]|uniref:universal stress protein n=1 Tax=Candidatus Solirubrobacter pratensis TaxID=1298857 RepID=UPI000410A755|nr:universal stress protein [Candidatus Solirubrobacter pratensis]